MTSETFTISGISQRTGLDRRSVQRALIDTKPVKTRTNGREVAYYDRDETTRALVSAGLPMEKIGRLAPFGGSVSRLVAWNVLTRYVHYFQRCMASARKEWPESVGVTAGQADRIGSIVAIAAAQLADQMLSEFGDRFPETATIDDCLADFPVPVRDAEAGSFMQGDITDPPVIEMFAAGAAEVARTKSKD